MSGPQLLVHVLLAPGYRTSPRPIDGIRVTGWLRQQVPGIRHDIDATQIKPVSIPASSHGDLLRFGAPGMAFERQDKEVKVTVIQGDVLFTNRHCQPSGARAMFRVSAIVLAARIMEQSEVFDNARVCTRHHGEPQSVVADARPVRDTMDAVQFEAKRRP